MVAPLVAAAGIGAVGSLIGGLTGGKGAKSAARTQQQVAQQQIAAQQAALSQITNMNQPAITRGNEAAGLYGGLLGVGDAAASQAALGTWRNSTGYQDLLQQGLGAVNANAYARGMGDSGAALKALQTRGTNIANQSQQQYLGNLGALINAGTQAAGNVAGITQNVTNANNQYLGNAADAQSNSALLQSANWQKALQGVFNAGSYALGSSYGGQPNPYGVTSRYGNLY